jgi:hypothetical protein
MVSTVQYITKVLAGCAVGNKIALAQFNETQGACTCMYSLKTPIKRYNVGFHAKIIIFNANGYLLNQWQ